MKSEGVSLPLVHQHPMIPWNDLRKCQCCGRCKAICDGYYCKSCDFFVHKECADKFRNPPPQASSEAEGKLPPEIDHAYHALHPLKLLEGQPPYYSDGKCSLCGGKNDVDPFYHCSTCNFTLDLSCVFHPPPQSLLDLRVHDHQLTLLPRLDSFTCNACGLKGDQSPYICGQCGFMIHQDCLALPRVININRHEHRVSRTSVLGLLNSVCGVCLQKVDRTIGGYSCQLCPSYAVHSKCATRGDVWNGKELEGIPEETEDIEPYVVKDDNTIQHFSHKEHYLKPYANGLSYEENKQHHLKLHANGLLYEEHKRCKACTDPISLQSFYGCIDCDFILHKSCAGFPRKKWHVLHGEWLTLVTSKSQLFVCVACRRMSNGFMYQDGNQKFDVQCGSTSDPFVHPSHDHPLNYTSTEGDKVCNGCHRSGLSMLRCIEIDCEFFLCFGCANLPQKVKHIVDYGPLSLCYGEKATGIYWCDICEKKTNPKKWFYICEDDGANLHTECVLGDFLRLVPRSTIELWGISYEVVLNNSVSRPFCWKCKSHCMHPLMLKMLGTSDTYCCSFRCTELGSQRITDSFYYYF